jgi:transposase
MERIPFDQLSRDELIDLTGLPLDTVLGEFSFYWGLNLRKSQADAMWNRLAKGWLPEFDALCQLLAVSAVVHADETSWSINSVWAFLSEKARVTVFGCHKDGQTLDVLLKKGEFEGNLVSDELIQRDIWTLEVPLNAAHNGQRH